MTRAEATVTAALVDILGTQFQQRGRTVPLEELAAAIIYRIRNGPDSWAFVALAAPVGREADASPLDFASAMNRLTPEQMAKAVEILNIEAQVWAFQFEALGQPTDAEKRGTEAVPRSPAEIARSNEFYKKLGENWRPARPHQPPTAKE